MSSVSVADPGAFCGAELTLVNRCRAHGIACCEAEDAVVLDLRDPATIAGLGVMVRALDGQQPARALRKTQYPRIAIYSGAAIGYPYWAYYAHAFLSLGLTFVPLSADDVAAGRLHDFTALVLPGGFATWGLDRAEGIAGIDAAIRSFIMTGGVLLGSCGGAFYVSEGRPGWLGVIDATPKFTQEYLATGAALVSISVDNCDLARGLPEAIELPYYHGPVYANRPRAAAALGSFRTYIQASRLFIDNPLDPGFFQAEMQGSPAIFHATFGRGAVLAFSPHPEMGEFVRKGIILESYVRHFLPIRGHRVMDQTLRFLAKDDSASFRLIYNALRHLGLFGEEDAEGVGRWPVLTDETSALLAALSDVDAALARMDTVIDQQVAAETPAMQVLLRMEVNRRRDEWRAVMQALRAQSKDGGLDRDLVSGLTAALRDAVVSLSSCGKIAENLVLSELPVRLCAAALRLILSDRVLRAGR